MGIEIPDRQGLHMREHRVTDFFERTLPDDYHGPVVKPGGKHPDDIDQAHKQNYLKQFCKYRMRLSQQRNDVPVDQDLQEQRRRSTCDRA